MTALLPDDLPRTGRSLDALTNRQAAEHAALRRSASRLIEDLAELSECSTGSAALMAAQHAAIEFVMQLRGHLDKEEHLLFPALHLLAKADTDRGSRPALPFSTVLYPIRVMERDHLVLEAALEHLERILRELAPLERTETWQGCVARLSDLGSSLRSHQRRENEGLFPLALEVEQRLS